MERRHFLKLAFGFAAGATALAAGAEAAPLMPQAPVENGPLPPSKEGAQPAVTDKNEVERLTPDEVRWGRRRGWGRRRWRWRRRGWRRRYSGWYRRRRRRRYWRRRYW